MVMMMADKTNKTTAKNLYFLKNVSMPNNFRLKSKIFRRKNKG